MGRSVEENCTYSTYDEKKHNDERRRCLNPPKIIIYVVVNEGDQNSREIDDLIKSFLDFLNNDHIMQYQ